MSFDVMGPIMDRRWMVVDAKNRFLTQREIPAMCKISAHVVSDCLVLGAEGKTQCLVPTPYSAVALKVQVWGDTVSAVDCGEASAHWLSEFLGVHCRLLYMPSESRRLVDTNYALAEERVSFADGFPLLLISQASLDDLNSRLVEKISMARFRPNIVVSGCEAFAEDNWQRLRIGERELSVVKPCTRCVIPSIDPVTGVQQSEVVRELAKYRRKDGEIIFGQNLLVAGTGDIEPGDSVEILA